MTTTTARIPNPVLLAGIATIAVVLGALAGSRPTLALGIAAAMGVLALAFMAPVANLTLLVGVLTLVPYGVQNSYSISLFGSTSAGVIFSDVILASGALWAATTLARRPLTWRELLGGVAALAVVAVACVDAVRGWDAGRDISVVGYELRVLLGWVTVLIALPLLSDRGSAGRLLKGLAVIGLALGLWGLVQWFADLPLSGPDVGVRYGVAPNGQGQIQGGLFAFPLAFLTSVALYASGAITSRGGRLLVLAIAITNGISLLLTFERTMWVATGAGLLLLLLREGWSQRLRVAALLGALGATGLVALGAVAPAALDAARLRFLSLGQYASDNSVRTRIVEARHMLAKIDDKPAAGWGLGDEIHWGMPWLQVPPTSTDYAHNGYLWLAWKLGIPAAVLLCLLLAWMVVARGPPNLDPLSRAVRQGCQASLFAMLVVCVTFPSLRALGVTAVIGLMVAICLAGARFDVRPRGAAYS